jgi:uncharacterized protein YktB (UPF0637 family)
MFMHTLDHVQAEAEPESEVQEEQVPEVFERGSTSGKLHGY